MRSVVSVLVLTLAAASPAAAQDPSRPAVTPYPIDADHDAATLLDETVEELVEIEQRPWTALVVHPDGQTVDVYFLGGDPECTKLHDVEVGMRPDRLEITILTGRPPSVRACREPLLMYVATVDLEQALVAGGRNE
jgi:hypothetical protein